METAMIPAWSILFLLDFVGAALGALTGFCFPVNPRTAVVVGAAWGLGIAQIVVIGLLIRRTCFKTGAPGIRGDWRTAVVDNIALLGHVLLFSLSIALVIMLSHELSR